MHFMGINIWIIITVCTVLLVVITFVGILLWNHKSKMAVRKLASIDAQIKTFKKAPVTTNEESPPTVLIPKAVPKEEGIAVDRHNVGKSGRVYTKEELEIQIKS